MDGWMYYLPAWIHFRAYAARGTNKNSMRAFSTRKHWHTHPSTPGSVCSCKLGKNRVIIRQDQGDQFFLLRLELRLLLKYTEYDWDKKPSRTSLIINAQIKPGPRIRTHFSWQFYYAIENQQQMPKICFLWGQPCLLSDRSFAQEKINSLISCSHLFT